MAFSSRWRVSLASAVASVVMVSAPVEAQSQAPRVAMGPFSGFDGDEVAERIGGFLDLHGGEVEPIPGSTYFGVASRLGLDGRLGEEDIARVAREIRADAVIVGDVVRSGRRHELRLRIARGRDGVVVGTINLEFVRVVDLDNLEGDLWRELSQHISQIVPLRAGGNPNNNPNNNSSNPNNNNPNNNSNSNQTPVEQATPASNPNGYPSALPGLGVIQLTAGGGFSSRSWRVAVLGMSMPREYINNGFFEVRAAAHIYPLRFQRDHLGVGVFGQGLVPLAISSTGTTAEGASTRLPTSAYELNAGLAVAYLPRGGGAFRATAGAYLHSFSVGTEALPFDRQYPRISYIGAQFRGSGMVPLVANSTIAFGLLFAGELRIGAIGDEARAAFGNTPAMTTGFGGGAGAELRLNGPAPGFSVQVMADWLRYRTAFNGPSRIGPGRDSADDYFRIHATLSYAFGVNSGHRAEESNNAREETPAPEATPPPPREESPAAQQPQVPPQPPPPRRDPFSA